jgi:hypothetical protein
MEMQNFLLHVFMKTGGHQPTTLDSKEIDGYFVGNIAKVWAMTKGFIANFQSFENGELRFKLITDPRCNNVVYMSLCKYIAKSFKDNVALLRDAASFKAEHYIANDIIGFNLAGDEMLKLEEYEKRVQASYDSLPSKPDIIHLGKIL